MRRWRAVTVGAHVCSLSLSGPRVCKHTPAITSTPSFLDRTVVAAYDLDSVSAVSQLLDADGVPSLANLHLASSRHLQATLHTSLCHAVRSATLPTISTLASARIRSAAGWGAAAILTAVRLKPAFFLSDPHFTFYLTHRLGLPHPSIPIARLATCSRRCPTIKTPMTAPSPLAYTVPHAYHHLGCQKYSSRIDRHNHRTAVLHRHLSTLGIYSAEMVKGLFSSTLVAYQSHTSLIYQESPGTIVCD